MRKISIFLVLLSLLFSAFVFTACDQGGEALPDYQIVVRETDYVKINENGFVIEADNTVTIPQGEVFDKEGKYCEDFRVARVITDKDGNRKAGTLQMKHGEVYTVNYTATNGEIELTREYKLYAYDTTLPELTLLDIQRSYNVGDNVSIKVNTISYDVDYEKSTFILKNETKGTETALSFKDNNAFVAETESESYKIIANLVDTNGNTQKFEYGFVIAGNFKDTEIANNDIWDFDEIGYINNIKVSGESDDLDYSIVTTGIPEDTASIGVGKGALKLELKEGERYVFTLTNGDGVVVSDTSTIAFRIWATEVIDIFELYNTSDGTMRDLSWKANQRGKWQDVEFDPLGAFAYDYTIESVRIVLSCEQDVTVYIDSIFYNDYVEKWRDEDIASDEIAVFDDPGYLERVSEPLNIDSTTFGGSWEYVTEVPGTTDFTGGVLKFTSTYDAWATSDNRSRDGFKFEFFDKLSYDEIGGFMFRVYCVDPHQVLSVTFVDQRMGISGAYWLSIDGVVGEWITVVLTKDMLKDVIEGYSNLTHMSLRFLRRAELQVEGQDEYHCYIDKISLYEINYDRIDYTFEDDYDSRIVQSVYYSSPFRVEDEGTNDGWAIHSTTGFSATGSGIKINFNHLDLSQYSSIYVRVKTTVNGSNNNRIDINGNDTYFVYGGYNEYTTIDLLPYFLKNGFTHLDNIQLSAKTAEGIGIYVDEIVLVKKEDAPKYDDFTLNAEQLLPFAGTFVEGNFSGGNTANINQDSVNVGAYQDKDSVLTFTTTAHDTSNYSGGGVYIDIRDYVASGKIVVSQDFTITFNLYLTQSTGFRVGVIYGENLESHSFNNHWANGFDASKGAGWHTYTVTSAELRAISGCSNVEMTGIYIASAGSVGSTYAIESVSFDFADAQ